MEKKYFVLLIILMILLVSSIALMSISLLVRERTFGQVSGYLAIGSVVITLIGVTIIIRSHKNKGE